MHSPKYTVLSHFGHFDAMFRVDKEKKTLFLSVHRRPVFVMLQQLEHHQFMNGHLKTTTTTTKKQDETANIQKDQVETEEKKYI
ncbi:hypothetical protein F7725_019971 [Dissostichus mawsoni]|uniref:Uncharacterized protein n=1 Tax=Dissostichus mawsoni TaxID=36200 RepID=A0A7J5YL80_DISMA|nr:hypothetical protein F7725_019971 [Dissostichus mawsoni]